MYLYRAYGLLIQSELDLPEFVAVSSQGDPPVDLVICWGERSQIPEEIIDRPQVLQISEVSSLFYRKDQVAFRVLAGHRVEVISFPGTEAGLIRAYLVGLVMSMVLYQRHYLVLHASVVTSGAQAIAFMGASGGGKSSLATALHLRGWEFCNDDVAPLYCQGHQVWVTPGFPQIKLTEESALALGQDLDHLLTLHAAEEKRGLKLTHRYGQSSLPLRCVFVLRTGEHLQVSGPLSPSQAVHEMLLQSLPTRFRLAGNPNHLQTCAQVAGQIPFFVLQRTRCLDQLSDLAGLVEQHLTRCQTA